MGAAVSVGAGGGATVPLTDTLVETDPLTKETVLLLAPAGAAPVRRTKTDALVTAPLELVSSESVLVKPLEALVEMAKLFESVAVTVMLLERFDALTTKLVLGPKFPWVAVRFAIDEGTTEMLGAVVTALTETSLMPIWRLLPDPVLLG